MDGLRTFLTIVIGLACVGVALYLVLTI